MFLEMVSAETIDLGQGLKLDMSCSSDFDQSDNQLKEVITYLVSFQEDKHSDLSLLSFCQIGAVGF